jgi:hypothetical protein
MPVRQEPRDPQPTFADLQRIVRAFERCEFLPEEFHHADHLTVITHYLERMPLRRALSEMRAALVRFSAHHNRKGYNETITRFWIAKVAQVLATLPNDLPLAELLSRVREQLSSKELVFEYYSRERVLSEDAKQQWVEPDLKPL